MQRMTERARSFRRDWSEVTDVLTEPYSELSRDSPVTSRWLYIHRAMDYRTPQGSGWNLPETAKRPPADLATSARLR